MAQPTFYRYYNTETANNMGLDYSGLPTSQNTKIIVNPDGSYLFRAFRFAPSGSNVQGIVAKLDAFGDPEWIMGRDLSATNGGSIPDSYTAYPDIMVSPTTGNVIYLESYYDGYYPSIILCEYDYDTGVKVNSQQNRLGINRTSPRLLPSSSDNNYIIGGTIEIGNTLTFGVTSVSDSTLHIDPNAFLTHLGGNGTEVQWPSSVTYPVYAGSTIKGPIFATRSNYNNSTIYIFNPSDSDGSFSGRYNKAITFTNNGTTYYPMDDIYDMKIDDDGSVYFCGRQYADGANYIYICNIDPSGVASTVFFTDGPRMYTIQKDSSGNFLVAGIATLDSRVFTAKVSADMSFITYQKKTDSGSDPYKLVANSMGSTLSLNDGIVFAGRIYDSASAHSGVGIVSLDAYGEISNECDPFMITTDLSIASPQPNGQFVVSDISNDTAWEEYRTS